MIKIIRTREPKAVEYLLPHLVLRDNSDENKMKFARGIIATMTSFPETVLLIQAWKGEDIMGFVVALTADDHVWVAQAWSAPGNPPSVADEMFNRTVIWTIALGRMSMRAETTRSPDAMLRRFKFEPISTIVEHRIKPEVIENILERGKEYING